MSLTLAVRIEFILYAIWGSRFSQSKHLEVGGYLTGNWREPTPLFYYNIDKYLRKISNTKNQHGETRLAGLCMNYVISLSKPISHTVADRAMVLITIICLIGHSQQRSPLL